MDSKVEELRNKLYLLFQQYEAITNYKITRVSPEKINKLIKELMDENIKSIGLLNEIQTLVLRKKLKSIDLKFIKQFQDFISWNNDFKYILYKLYCMLNNYYKTPTYDTLSTILPYDDKHIWQLELDDGICDCLIKNGISYLYQLLSFPKSMLKNILVSKNRFKIVCEYIHNKNLKFVDELTLDELKDIYKNSPKIVIQSLEIAKKYGLFLGNSDFCYTNEQVIARARIIIDNSPSYWTGLDIKYPKNPTIGKVVKYYLSNVKTSNSSKEEILSRIKILETSLENDLEKSYYTLAELKDMNIDDILNFDLSKIFEFSSIVNILRKNKIITIKDLIFFPTSRLVIILPISINYFRAIIDSIHDLGLIFIDEIDDKKYNSLEDYLNALKLSEAKKR